MNLLPPILTVVLHLSLPSGNETDASFNCPLEKRTEVYVCGSPVVWPITTEVGTEMYIYVRVPQ
jgi:hypothetical protein